MSLGEIILIGVGILAGVWVFIVIIWLILIRYMMNKV